MPGVATDLIYALRELPKVDKAPEWIELFPKGPKISAVDGRSFLLTKIKDLISKFAADPNPIPLDYEHATETRAPNGKDAPAAGWIEAIEDRAGAVWARIAWTPRGAESVKSREYRYVSPAFIVDKTTKEIVELISAGLTNRPALRMTAITNRQSNGAKTMDPIRVETCKRLGLKDDATDDQILEALKKADKDQAKAIETARAEATPDLTKFVPRADFDKVREQCTSLQKSIDDGAAEALKTEADAEIEAAQKAGKITPATSDYYRDQCKTREGLEAFREFVKAATKVVDDESDLKKKKPDTSTEKLTAEQREVAKACGLTDDEYLAGVEK